MRLSIAIVLLALLSIGIEAPEAKADELAVSDDLRAVTEMSSDMLMALFLKLNISDPNNDPVAVQRLQLTLQLLRLDGQIGALRAEIQRVRDLIAVYDRFGLGWLLHGTLSRLYLELFVLLQQRAVLVAQLAALD